MENTVTISLNEYNKLRDALTSLIEIEKGYDHTFYSKEDTSGHWYMVRTSDKEIIKISNKLKDTFRKLNIMQTKNMGLQETIESLKKHIANNVNELYVNKPWYKQIFK